MSSLPTHAACLTSRRTSDFRLVLVITCKHCPYMYTYTSISNYLSNYYNAAQEEIFTRSEQPGDWAVRTLQPRNRTFHTPVSESLPLSPRRAFHMAGHSTLANASSRSRDKHDPARVRRINATRPSPVRVPKADVKWKSHSARGVQLVTGRATRQPAPPPHRQATHIWANQELEVSSTGRQQVFLGAFQRAPEPRPHPS